MKIRLRTSYERELADLIEIVRRESLDEFINNIRYTRTRPYSRISAICMERKITLAEVCMRGPRDSETGILYRYIKQICGERIVTIYRGGKTRSASEIKPGDWVALDEKEARWYGRFVSKLNVTPYDVVWAGTYEKEWFYIPRHLQGLFKDVREFWEASRNLLSH